MFVLFNFMNRELMRKFFPKAIKRIDKKECPFCSKKINETEFKDMLSLKEFHISGLCQNCQDKTFGK